MLKKMILIILFFFNSYLHSNSINMGIYILKINGKISEPSLAFSQPGIDNVDCNGIMYGFKISKGIYHQIGVDFEVDYLPTIFLQNHHIENFQTIMKTLTIIQIQPGIYFKDNINKHLKIKFGISTIFNHQYFTSINILKKTFSMADTLYTHNIFGCISGECVVQINKWINMPIGIKYHLANQAIRIKSRQGDYEPNIPSQRIQIFSHVNINRLYPYIGLSLNF